MNKENWDIQFIKPCRHAHETHRILTPAYTLQMAQAGYLVQINLDNCSIQRMEDLTEAATVEDVERVGLLPLYRLLNEGKVALSGIGVHEMPEWRVSTAQHAYERFCRKFWPAHKDDTEATQRPYDTNAAEQRVTFTKLDDGSRLVFGCAYTAFLHIQNVKLNHSNLSPEDQFSIYLHGMISMIDMVSAFELEIAKYAFWTLNKKEINQLPPTIKQRRKDIIENFAKPKSTLEKCKSSAFDSALDLFWLSGANVSDLKGDIEIAGKKLKIDSWVGTNDHKLYRISRDIHSCPFEGSTMRRLATTRENELVTSPYWMNVDAESRELLRYRHDRGHSKINDFLQRIDSSVNHLEKNIETFFTEKPNATAI
ncbi:hypothetical protein ACI77I_22720 [Pseudomonas sp. D47]|uniref:hypothetical protein n=1 Tax=Pseudomonas sp. D47 TaxID=3159447 RepID=UPI00387A9809